MAKPILCLDFDGVCNSYSSGWQGATVIPDPPVPGMWHFLEGACLHFDVHIYSGRSGSPGGIDAMRAWFLRHADTGYRQDIVKKWLCFPATKPPAFLTLDDRAWLFTGQWPTIEDLRAFQPWHKQAVFHRTSLLANETEAAC